MLGFVLTSECADPHSNVVLALLFWGVFFLACVSTFPSFLSRCYWCSCIGGTSFLVRQSVSIWSRQTSLVSSACPMAGLLWGLLIIIARRPNWRTFLCIWASVALLPLWVSLGISGDKLQIRISRNANITPMWWLYLGRIGGDRLPIGAATIHPEGGCCIFPELYFANARSQIRPLCWASFIFLAIGWYSHFWARRSLWFCVFFPGFEPVGIVTHLCS